MYKLKKVLSLALTCVLVVSLLLNTAVLAGETTEGQTEQSEKSTEIQTGSGSEEAADDQTSGQEDSSKTDAQDENGEDGEDTPEETKAPETSETSDGAESPEDAGESDGAESLEDGGTSGRAENPEDEETSDRTENPEDEETSDGIENPEDEETSGETGDPEETEMSDGTGNPEEMEMSDGTESPEETEIESSEETEMSEETEEPEETEMSETEEGQEETGEAEETEKEKQSENSASEEATEETETEEVTGTEEETAEEETETAFVVIQDVVLVLEEYSEEELKALPLSAILSRLQDSEGNWLEIPEDVSTVWILIKNENKTPVFEKKYEINSKETVDLSQYANQPGYTLELTVGNGEKQDSGNIQYVAEMKYAAEEESGIMPMSLLPLKEVPARLYVNGYEEETIKATPVKWILENLKDRYGNSLGLQMTENTKVSWYHYKAEEEDGIDDYVTAEPEDTIDLSTFVRESRNLELIVGNGKQLGYTNVRYIVTVSSVWVYPEVSCQVYVQRADGTRAPLEEVLCHYEPFEEETESGRVGVHRFVNPEHSEGDTYYMSVTPTDYNSDNSFWEAAVYDYEGLMSLLSGTPDAPAITDQALSKNLEEAGAGYQGTFGAYQNKYFGLVYKNPDTGKVYETERFGIEVLEDSCTISPSLYKVDEESGKTEVGDVYSEETLDLEQAKARDVNYIRYSLYTFNLASDSYKLTFDIKSAISGTDYSTVEKAVVGLYDSEEDVPDGIEDIKDQLISYNGGSAPGYSANYSRAGGGKDFTLFFGDGRLAKYHVEIPTAYYGTTTIRLTTDETNESGERKFVSSSGYIYNSDRGEEAVTEDFTLYAGYSMTDEYYLTFTNNTMTSLDFVNKIFVGQYDSQKAAEDANAEEVKEKVLKTGQDAGPEGYKANYGTEDGVYFTLFYEDGTYTIVQVKIGDVESFDLGLDASFYDADGQFVGSAYSPLDLESESKEIPLDILVSKDSLKDEYICKLEYYKNSNGKVPAITHAVLGQFDTADAVENAPNIKEQLFSDEGCAVDYSDENGGVTFTLLFDDNSLCKVTVSISPVQDPGEEELPDLESMEEIKEPVVGEPDRWLEITGATQNGKDLSIYVVKNGVSTGSYYDEREINLDTAYGYGYFTVFVDTTEALTNVIPEFRSSQGDSVKLYSARIVGDKVEPTKRMISGVTDEDFSKGPVLFVLAVEKGGKSVRRNYVIDFKNKAEGPKLYVAGPKSPEKREVFLDEYHEYKHDILIANLGDQPLTGLTVKLDEEAAKNCELDSYWTVNNDTLAPFTTTKEGWREEEPTDEELEEYAGEYTDYGILPNLAKVSLLPKEDGDISGTLTVTADGQDPVVIELTGHAQNPRITTEELDDAVKYVPYSCIITTNNMHDWIREEYSVEGDLPDGVELFPQTGEIYGVPLEEGEFHVTITANFIYDGDMGTTKTFTPSTAELTLTVKSNTDDNVYNASDVGYTIMNSVGTDLGRYNFVMDEIEDQIFRSSGEFPDFQDLWLNGEKLTRDVDYTAESGSTKIVIQSQTFNDKAIRGSSNTLAAEFRVEGDRNKELKRTAQNFRLNIPSSTETEKPKPETEQPKPETEKPKPETEKPNPGPETEKPGPETEKPNPGPETEKPGPETEKPNPGPETEKPGPETEKPNPGPETEKPGPETEKPNPGPETEKPGPETEKPNPEPETEKPGPETEKPNPGPETEKPGPETEKPNPGPETEKPGPETEKPNPGPETEKPGSETEKPNPGPETEKPNPGPETEKPGPETEKPEPGSESETTENPGTEAGTESESKTTTESPVADTVNFTVRLIDGEGNPLAGRLLELHSTPVLATTDTDGVANFGEVEVGRHTLYLKDSSGNTVATKEFVLQKGSASESFVQDDVITASSASAVTVTMTYADNALTIDSVKNGTSAPQTGDDTPVAFWLTLLLISCGVLVVAGRRRRTSR